MTTQIGTAYRARAPFASCWGGPTAAVPAQAPVPFATVKASHQSGSLMIRTDVNVWPLSPKDWSTG